MPVFSFPTFLFWFSAAQSPDYPRPVAAQPQSLDPLGAFGMGRVVLHVSLPRTRMYIHVIDPQPVPD